MSQPGISVGNGITFGSGVTAGGAGPITGGTITYAEMAPPVVAGFQLQDNSATVNGSVGFTINNSANTGVAVIALTTANQTFFDNQGVGTFAASFGPGSTHATATVQITQVGGVLIFFIDNTISYPATFNYPFTIA
jgi:hypothetical protein